MIRVNGESHDYTAEFTVSDLLKAKNFIFPLLIVKINGEFVPRERYKTTRIPDKANVEVIHLISGG